MSRTTKETAAKTALKQPTEEEMRQVLADIMMRWQLSGISSLQACSALHDAASACGFMWGLRVVEKEDGGCHTS